MVLGHEQVTEHNCRHAYGFQLIYKRLSEAYVYRCVLCPYEMNFSPDEAGRIPGGAWIDRIVSHPNDLVVKETLHEGFVESSTKTAFVRTSIRRK